jgi:hypothetical protein
MKIPMKIFCGARWDGGFWFRVFGYGIRVADRSKHPAVFGERDGYIWVLRIGKWSILPLKRRDMIWPK